jgi:hypothetical protein
VENESEPIAAVAPATKSRRLIMSKASGRQQRLPLTAQ